MKTSLLGANKMMESLHGAMTGGIRVTMADGVTWRFVGGCTSKTCFKDAVSRCASTDSACIRAAARCR